jgi:hypothetical protein
MPISVDELNTTLSDLRSGWQSTFAHANPLTRQLVNKKKVSTESEGGTHIEHVLMTGSPSQGVGVSTGYEVSPGVRRNKTKLLKNAYYEFFQTISISGKEMRENNGVRGIVKLMKMYPDAAAKAFKADFNKYLLTGTTDSLSSPSPSDYYGFITLNGDFASGIVDGTENGLLDFRTLAEQTSDAQVVEGVAKSSTTGHVNQYGLISAWATDGQEKHDSAYFDAAGYADSDSDDPAGPDLEVMDRATFAHYIGSKKDTVRVDIINKDTDGKVSNSSTHYRAKVVYDVALDRTLFSGTGTGGVIYGLNTDYWEWCILHDMDISPFIDLLATQDVVTAKLLFHGQGMCERLNTQFVIGGGAT